MGHPREQMVGHLIRLSTSMLANAAMDPASACCCRPSAWFPRLKQAIQKVRAGLEHMF